MVSRSARLSGPPQKLGVGMLMRLSPAKNTMLLCPCSTRSIARHAISKRPTGVLTLSACGVALTGPVSNRMGNARRMNGMNRGLAPRCPANHDTTAQNEKKIAQIQPIAWTFHVDTLMVGCSDTRCCRLTTPSSATAEGGAARAARWWGRRWQEHGL